MKKQQIEEEKKKVGGGGEGVWGEIGKNSGEKRRVKIQKKGIKKN